MTATYCFGRCSTRTLPSFTPPGLFIACQLLPIGRRLAAVPMVCRPEPLQSVHGLPQILNDDRLNVGRHRDAFAVERLLDTSHTVASDLQVVGPEGAGMEADTEVDRGGG